MRIGKVYFSSGFLLLFSWLFYCDRSGTVWLGLLSCILHELGHLTALIYFQSNVKEISITIFGAKINFDNRLSYVEEMVTAAAGPCVNLILALVSSKVLNRQVFAGINLALASFNLLPIGPLDGARILQCLLAQMGSDDISCRLSRCVTFSFTALFGGLGLAVALWGRNPTLLLMSIWLLIGCSQ